jgi:hypothetical protein
MKMNGKNEKKNTKRIPYKIETKLKKTQIKCYVEHCLTKKIYLEWVIIY